MVESYALCITLPRASRTACDVKFSEGIRLIKCFCLLFSCAGVSMWYSRLWLSILDLLDNVIDSRVGLLEIGREQLVEVSAVL